VAENQRERERGRRVRERDVALSHDRARCNARAAMHKQRRASRSAPAKVTRVMSRCPLCRTNSATRPKAHSRVRSDGGGGGGGGGGASAGREEGGGGNRPAPLRPLVASPPSGIRYWEARGNPLWLKPGASGGASARRRARARYATRRAECARKTRSGLVRQSNVWSRRGNLCVTNCWIDEACDNVDKYCVK